MSNNESETDRRVQKAGKGAHLFHKIGTFSRISMANGETLMFSFLWFTLTNCHGLQQHLKFKTLSGFDMRSSSRHMVNSVFKPPLTPSANRPSVQR